MTLIMDIEVLTRCKEKWLYSFLSYPLLAILKKFTPFGVDSSMNHLKGAVHYEIGLSFK